MWNIKELEEKQKKGDNVVEGWSETLFKFRCPECHKENTIFDKDGEFADGARNEGMDGEVCIEGIRAQCSFCKTDVFVEV